MRWPSDIPPWRDVQPQQTIQVTTTTVLVPMDGYGRAWDLGAIGISVPATETHPISVRLAPSEDGVREIGDEIVTKAVAPGEAVVFDVCSIPRRTYFTVDAISTDPANPAVQVVVTFRALPLQSARAAVG